jgi:endonuclease YncB( thermonuclease family)
MKKNKQLTSKLILLILGAFILLSPLPSSYKKQVYSFVEDLFIEYDNTPPDCFKVSYVVDGDTIVIYNEDKEKETLRLYGIDAFETKDNDRLKKQKKEYSLSRNEVISKGNEAKEYLEGKFSKYGNNNRYSDKNGFECVYITRKGKDKYGRTLAKIYYGADDNRVSIQDDLLGKGLVKVY